ncbi:MAG: pantoate--beta-alanine ligase [Bacteroidia bacterium]
MYNSKFKNSFAPAMAAVFTQKFPLKNELEKFRKKGKKIGFVPTMGALHQGHFSLLEKSKRDNDITVCSIFVNPTQFNNSKDYINYPRNPEADVKALQRYQIDLIFLPSSEEMYSVAEETLDFDAGKIAEIMEGKFRPGHFAGVASIVHKFLEIVNPDRAYFGQKDFQQYLLIRKLAKERNPNVEIVACPTTRNEAGLALSSRNQLLTREQQDAATAIYRTLTKAGEMVMAGRAIQEVKAWALQNLALDELLKPEYFEIVNAETLNDIKSKSEAEKILIAAAVRAGEIRLLDNIVLE